MIKRLVVLLMVAVLLLILFRVAGLVADLVVIIAMLSCGLFVFRKSHK